MSDVAARLVAEPDRAALVGSLVADALAMPVHGYADRAAIERDYPELAGDPAAVGFLAPRPPGPDWRAGDESTGAVAAIEHPRARQATHRHQFVPAGGNTLGFRLAIELAALVRRNRHYDAERWLDEYVAFMRRPEHHRDTAVDDCHHHFFTNLAQGRKPINCGVHDRHASGLAQVPALVAVLGGRHPDLVDQVRVHVGLTHKDPDVVDAAAVTARILRRVCRGADLREAIDHEAGAWLPADRRHDRDDRHGRATTTEGDGPVGESAGTGRAGDALGSDRGDDSAAIRESFPAALALAWRHAGDFTAGIVASALAGGDSCHRGAVVGALLGASTAIPLRLVNALECRDRVAWIFDADL